MVDTNPASESITDSAVKFEDMYQVLIYNDHVNSMDHVVRCLVSVFSHPETLAVKIMLEAHVSGRAIAEVETQSSARAHVLQLKSYGLTAETEKI